jgi:hypothetical protein
LIGEVAPKPVQVIPIEQRVAVKHRSPSIDYLSFRTSAFLQSPSKPVNAIAMSKLERRREFLSALLAS